VLREPTFELSYDDVLRARKDLSDHLAPSQLNQSARLAKLTGIDLFVKKENTLRSGSVRRNLLCFDWLSFLS
jgi:threonine dehydratase